MIHQTWKSEEIPDSWQASHQTWKELAEEHNWEYRLWTDEENEKFLSEHYSWALEFYHRLPLGIQRSHMMRYFYMFHFGGVYVDLDVIPKPDRIMHLLMTVSDSYRVLLSTEMHQNGSRYVSTGWMMSTKQHPLWKQVISNLIAEEQTTWEKAWTSTFRHYEVVMRTGPLFLTEQLEKYQAEHEDNMEDILVLPETWLRPAEGNKSNYVSLVSGGPSWRDWDSNVAEYGQWGWKNRDWLLLGVLFTMLVTIVIVLAVR